MNSTLFIVNSPLQALCALEAIGHYGIKEANFAVQDNDIVRKNTLPLLDRKGEIFQVQVSTLNTFAIIKNARKSIPFRYNRVFIGDYFSYWQLLIASSVSRVKAEFIYLDDGNSTLDILPPMSRERGKGRSSVWFNLVRLFNRTRLIKSSFFTFFDLGDKSPIPYEKNTFSSLVGDGVEKSNCVYVIGTNSSRLDFRNYPYEEYLKKLSSYITDFYPNNKVYYCPHRADTNDYSTTFKSIGWSLYNTEISIEVDFVKNKIVPSVVIGFGSTALFTLKKIYKNADIFTVYIDLLDKDLNKSYRTIEDYYQKHGIAILNLF